MVQIKENLSDVKNYGGKRSKVEYIVIHYTGNDGDSDENNGKYFKNNVVKASAHYFVDDDSITRSVPEDHIAYSVGGSKYKNSAQTGGGKYYGICTNANSISIELCDCVKDGKVKATDKTINNALELTLYLMKQYNISVSNVIRHFDVTGKPCPAYWVDDGVWEKEFKSKLTTNNVVSTPEKKNILKVSVSAKNGLNVRKGPSTNFNVTRVLKYGTKIDILEEKNGWGRISTNEWVCMKYTK